MTPFDFEGGDRNGNFIVIDLKLWDISIRLINVYAPNIDNPAFFEKIRKYVENSVETYTVSVGT